MVDLSPSSSNLMSSSSIVLLSLYFGAKYPMLHGIPATVNQPKFRESFIRLVSETSVSGKPYIIKGLVSVVSDFLFMSSSPMLIITFIHTFILLPAIAARPVTDGFFSNLTNHIRLRNDSSEAGSTYAMLLNASPSNVPHSTRFEPLNPAALIQQQSSRNSESAVNSTDSDVPLFNASFPVCSAAHWPYDMLIG